MGAIEETAPRWTRAGYMLFGHRRVVAVFIHLLLWSLSFAAAFFLRFEFELPDVPAILWWRWLGLLLIARLIAFYSFDLFRGLWRYTGASDLRALLKGTTLASIAFAAVMMIFGEHHFPRSIFFIEWLLAVCGVGGLRFVTRTVREFSRRAALEHSRLTRVLVVGAGNAGERLIRELQHGRRHTYTPVGFVDDDAGKRGAQIHGVPVLGAVADTPRIAMEHEVDEIIIAVPGADGPTMRRLNNYATCAGLPVRIVPQDLGRAGEGAVGGLREVRIEDLLRRPVVDLEESRLRQWVQDRCVLITGAGGSIGSQLSQLVAQYGPGCVALVDRNENALFQIQRALAQKNVNFEAVLADVADAERMVEVFTKASPDIVLHAAAYKHVPMMERNPREAIRNNVWGTKVVADLSSSFGASDFVLISTDKAVNPRSVMGATKRLAEKYVQAKSQVSDTKFVAVRFGNVLGSAGSVIPIFQEQIARGGPVTITHPDMSRYFMTIGESCQLVLQAAVMGEGGEIFVLDMGKPVRIMDLAQDLIRLSGLRVHEDVQFKFTGPRPGEKLFEEISVSEEAARKTRHPKIFIGRLVSEDYARLDAQVSKLCGMASGQREFTIKEALSQLVPEYVCDVESDARTEAPSAAVLH